jgi:hypothetical protein
MSMAQRERAGAASLATALADSRLQHGHNMSHRASFRQVDFADIQSAIMVS